MVFEFLIRERSFRFVQVCFGVVLVVCAGVGDLVVQLLVFRKGIGY